MIIADPISNPVMVVEGKPLEAPKTYLQSVFGGFLGTPATGWKEFARVISFIALTILTGTIAGWVAIGCLAADAYTKKDPILLKLEEFRENDPEGFAQHARQCYEMAEAQIFSKLQEEAGIENGSLIAMGSREVLNDV